jgi:hypothetical protein
MCDYENLNALFLLLYSGNISENVVPIEFIIYVPCLIYSLDSI